jgi:hypothetical protein
VFILAATSNVAAFFAALKSDAHDTWHYDVTKMSVAAGVIYGYLIVVPLLLYGGNL